MDENTPDYYKTLEPTELPNIQIGWHNNRAFRDHEGNFSEL